MVEKEAHQRKTEDPRQGPRVLQYSDAARPLRKGQLRADIGLNDRHKPGQPHARQHHPGRDRPEPGSAAQQKAAGRGENKRQPHDAKITVAIGRAAEQGRAQPHRAAQAEQTAQYDHIQAHPQRYDLQKGVEKLDRCIDDQPCRDKGGQDIAEVGETARRLRPRLPATHGYGAWSRPKMV